MFSIDPHAPTPNDPPKNHIKKRDVLGQTALQQQSRRCGDKEELMSDLTEFSLETRKLIEPDHYEERCHRVLTNSGKKKIQITMDQDTAGILNMILYTSVLVGHTEAGKRMSQLSQALRKEGAPHFSLLPYKISGVLRFDPKPTTYYRVPVYDS